MTRAEIYKAAEERYTIPPKACRTEKLDVKRLRRIFIEKMIKKHGLEGKGVNS